MAGEFTFEGLFCNKVDLIVIAYILKQSDKKRSHPIWSNVFFTYKEISRRLVFCIIYIRSCFENFFKRNEIRDGVENGLNLVQIYLPTLVDTRYMYWITAAKSNLDTRKAILLPLNSVFKISDIVKYNFFPTCKNILHTT